MEVEVDERQEREELFLIEVGRLSRAVRDLARQLDQVESDVRRVLDDVVRERFETYH